eukprot:2401970-Prymnesium_polylepis.1
MAARAAAATQPEHAEGEADSRARGRGEAAVECDVGVSGARSRYGACVRTPLCGVCTGRKRGCTVGCESRRWHLADAVRSRDDDVRTDARRGLFVCHCIVIAHGP